ncbi:MAG TPA: hypothetical protein DIT04_03760 [Dysgonomonas sp.]|nr:hypothetical protein [Dysgonomonas sp.]
MIDKMIKQFRGVFVLSLLFAVLTLIADALYNLKVIPADNPVLERWGIIITLFGIFGALKVFHPTLKKSEKVNKETALKKYASKYYLRLFFLLAIYIFNLVSLHVTGIKNFIFLGIITIFALLFCAPNKENIENETQVNPD